MGLGACGPYVPLTRAEHRARRDSEDPNMYAWFAEVESLGLAETESQADALGDDGFDLVWFSVAGYAFEVGAVEGVED
jgi:hypothetical protein